MEALIFAATVILCLLAAVYIIRLDGRANREEEQFERFLQAMREDRHDR